MERTQQIKYLCADFFTSALAWFLFNLIRYDDIAYLMFSSRNAFLSSYEVIEGQVFIPFGWIVLHYYSGYYNQPLGKSRLSEFFTTMMTVFIGTLIIFFIVLINELPESFTLYYKLFIVLFLYTFSLSYLFRFLITQHATKKVHDREWTIKTVILGNGNSAGRIRKLLEVPSDAMGFSVVGHIDTSAICSSTEFFSENVLGTLDDLGQIIKEEKIEELIVAVDTDDDKKLLQLLYSLYQYNLPIKLPINQSRLLIGNLRIKSLTSVPLINISNNNFSEYEKNIKKTLDIIVSSVVLVLLLPFYLWIAIRIKSDSPGPVFFKQERIGYRGKPFYMYKFRTMVVDAEKGIPKLSSENDHRITRFGQIMRKYRIDELPQFWNILKGDMSLVGPRPERRYYIREIVKKAPYYYLFHNVRPGITSWGMVKYGYASSIDQMIERLEYDLLYYENMSLLLDIKILIYTIKTVLTGKGI